MKECGLFVDKDHPYIGASPDRLVSFCCGEGVLEIKTSLACTTTGTAPTPKLLPYLVETDGTVSLKKKHAHYVQVQAQMALTGRKWADFLVYSSEGCYLERILFDQQLWMLVKEKAVEFWKMFVSPVGIRLMADGGEEVISPAVTTEPEDVHVSTHGKEQGIPKVPTTMEAGTQLSSSKTRKGKRGKGKGKAKKTVRVYQCGACGEICAEADAIHSVGETAYRATVVTYGGIGSV